MYKRQTLSNGTLLRIRADDALIETIASAALPIAPAHNSYSGLAYALAASAAADIWLLPKEASATARKLLTGVPAPLGLQFAPDGRALLLQYASRVDIYDLESAALRHRLDSPSTVESLTFARTNTLLRRVGSSILQTEFAGTACFPAQVPSASNQRFTLSARDVQGNAGAPSAAIELQPVVQALPDLSIVAADIRFLPAAGPPGAAYRAQITVRNLGVAPASPLGAEFSLRAPDGSSRSFTPTLPSSLNAASSVVVALDLGTLTQIGSYVLNAQVDPSDQVRESNENNNAAAGVLTISASGVPTLSLSVERTLLAPNEPLRGTLGVFNPGAQFGGRLTLEILDSAGAQLVALGSEPLTLASAQRFERSISHLPAAVLAASYAIRARLLPQVGDVPVATRQIAFQVAETATVTVGLRPQQPIAGREQIAHVAPAKGLKPGFAN